jgi:hypothetical protein
MTGPTEAHERGATMPESTAPDTGPTTETDDTTTEDTATVELAGVNPYEVVRVRSPRTGAHLSMTRAAAAARGAEVLEGRPAVGGLYGRPLPGKPKRELTRADTAGPFDPTTASVAKVREYLDGADAAEVTRVLEAELAGKNRTTITSWSPTTSTPTTVQED